MEYIKNTLKFHVDEPTVITLGKFDGLHRGHELLMESLHEKCSVNGYKSVVFTFDMPPRQQTQGIVGQVITTNEEKHDIFEQAGIDYLIECPFTTELMCMEPEAFIAWITRSLTVKCIVVGTDFRFGHNRTGDYKLLQTYAPVYGYEVIVVNKMQEDGRDISSTYIREEIQKGNIKKANHLLGYEYFVKSMVVHGNQIGRTIGIPTINMILPEEKILPPFGVYVTRVMIDEMWFMGVTNVGCKPTIEGNNPVGVETYIIDFCQDVYDKVISVQFLDFIRPEMKFPSLDALKSQMYSDIAQAQNYYKSGLHF